MKSSSRQAIGVVRGAIIAVVASALVLVVGASPSEAATNWMAQAGDFIEDELLEVNSFLPTDVTVVEGDTAVGAGEHRDLLPPAQVVAAGPVGEHHRRPFPLLLIIEVDSVDLCSSHGAGPIVYDSRAPSNR